MKCAYCGEDSVLETNIEGRLTPLCNAHFASRVMGVLDRLLGQLEIRQGGGDMRQFRILYTGENPVVVLNPGNSWDMLEYAEADHLVLKDIDGAVVLAEGVEFGNGLVAMLRAPGYNKDYIDNFASMSAALNRFTVYGTFDLMNVKVMYLDGEPE